MQNELTIANPANELMIYEAPKEEAQEETIEIASEALEYEYRIGELASQAKAYAERYKLAIGDLREYRERITELHKRGIRRLACVGGRWFCKDTGIEINDFVLLSEAQDMAQYTLNFVAQID